MKLICPDCESRYDSGKYCTDCGSQLRKQETETSPDIDNRPIDTSRSARTIRKDIKRWLTRIGVPKSEINIQSNSRDKSVTLQYVEVASINVFDVEIHAE